MTCMTLFVQPMAMATTQLACNIHHECAFSWRMEPKAEYKSLRMSWVVVTGERGERHLRMQWVAVEACGHRARPVTFL
jgi:hypothetical protein